jgi:glc operon protein GlcG
LRAIERETTVSTVIETVDSLKGGTIEKTAERLARQSGIQGIFILIAKKEHKVEVLESRKFQSALTRSRRDAITESFIADFRRQKFDEGLKHGVAAIETVLADASKTGDLPKAVPAARTFGLTPSVAPPAPFTSTLVVRDRVRLTLAGARTILAGAEAKAASMQRKINIAVVDDGGHLLAFERIDGARPASAYTAITKATSAATYRQPTGPQPPGAASPDLLLSLSLQNAAEASGGKITSLFGGVPIVVDDQVIGGVGVGGGTGEEDAQIARAGIQSLLDELAAKPKDTTEKGQ